MASNSPDLLAKQEKTNLKRLQQLDKAFFPAQKKAEEEPKDSLLPPIVSKSGTTIDGSRNPSPSRKPNTSHARKVANLGARRKANFSTAFTYGSNPNNPFEAVLEARPARAYIPKDMRVLEIIPPQGLPAATQEAFRADLELFLREYLNPGISYNDAVALSPGSVRKPAAQSMFIESMRLSNEAESIQLASTGREQTMATTMPQPIRSTTLQTLAVVSQSYNVARQAWPPTPDYPVDDVAPVSLMNMISERPAPRRHIQLLADWLDESLARVWWEHVEPGAEMRMATWTSEMGAEMPEVPAAGAFEQGMDDGEPHDLLRPIFKAHTFPLYSSTVPTLPPIQNGSNSGVNGQNGDYTQLAGAGYEAYATGLSEDSPEVWRQEMTAAGLASAATAALDGEKAMLANRFATIACSPPALAPFAVEAVSRYPGLWAGMEASVVSVVEALVSHVSKECWEEGALLTRIWNLHCNLMDAAVAQVRADNNSLSAQAASLAEEVQRLEPVLEWESEGRRRIAELTEKMETTVATLGLAESERDSLLRENSKIIAFYRRELKRFRKEQLKTAFKLAKKVKLMQEQIVLLQVDRDQLSVAVAYAHKELKAMLATLTLLLSRMGKIMMHANLDEQEMDEWEQVTSNLKNMQTLLQGMLRLVEDAENKHFQAEEKITATSAHDILDDGFADQFLEDPSGSRSQEAEAEIDGMDPLADILADMKTEEVLPQPTSATPAPSATPSVQNVPVDLGQQASSASMAASEAASAPPPPPVEVIETWDMSTQTDKVEVFKPGEAVLKEESDRFVSFPSLPVAESASVILPGDLEQMMYSDGPTQHLTHAQKDALIVECRKKISKLTEVNNNLRDRLETATEQSNATVEKLQHRLDMRMHELEVIKNQSTDMQKSMMSLREAILRTGMDPDNIKGVEDALRRQAIASREGVAAALKGNGPPSPLSVPVKEEKESSSSSEEESSSSGSGSEEDSGSGTGRGHSRHSKRRGKSASPKFRNAPLSAKRKTKKTTRGYAPTFMLEQEKESKRRQKVKEALAEPPTLFKARPNLTAHKNAVIDLDGPLPDVYAGFTTSHPRLLEALHRNAAPAPRPAEWAARLIDNIYKAKMMSDATRMKANQEPIKLAEFLFQHLSGTYGTHALVNQYAATFVATLNLHMDDMRLSTFSKFLSEEWDARVLATFMNALKRLSEPARVPCCEFPDMSKRGEISMVDVRKCLWIADKVLGRREQRTAYAFAGILAALSDSVSEEEISKHFVAPGYQGPEVAGVRAYEQQRGKFLKMQVPTFLDALCREYVRCEDMMLLALPGIFKTYDEDQDGYMNQADIANMLTAMAGALEKQGSKADRELGIRAVGPAANLLWTDAVLAQLKEMKMLEEIGIVEGKPPGTANSGTTSARPRTVSTADTIAASRVTQVSMSAFINAGPACNLLRNFVRLFHTPPPTDFSTADPHTMRITREFVGRSMMAATLRRFWTLHGTELLKYAKDMGSAIETRVMQLANKVEAEHDNVKQVLALHGLMKLMVLRQLDGLVRELKPNVTKQSNAAMEASLNQLAAAIKVLNGCDAVVDDEVLTGTIEAEITGFKAVDRRAAQRAAWHRVDVLAERVWQARLASNSAHFNPRSCIQIWLEEVDRRKYGRPGSGGGGLEKSRVYASRKIQGSASTLRDMVQASRPGTGSELDGTVSYLASGVMTPVEESS